MSSLPCTPTQGQQHRPYPSACCFSNRARNNNTLTDAEKADGWQLLFNGTNFDGWHNFHTTTVAPGWQVTDGVLVCANPKMAGDLVTSNQFSWFELQLDYNITDGGNSGILYHVTGEEPAWLAHLAQRS